MYNQMMMGEQVVVAYPCDDGIFFSVVDAPATKLPSCCSSENRQVASLLSHTPTQTNKEPSITSLHHQIMCII